jgi:hypothetical protein
MARVDLALLGRLHFGRNRQVESESRDLRLAEDRGIAPRTILEVSAFDKFAAISGTS